MLAGRWEENALFFGDSARAWYALHAPAEDGTYDELPDLMRTQLVSLEPI